MQARKSPALRATTAATNYSYGNALSEVRSRFDTLTTNGKHSKNPCKQASAYRTFRAPTLATNYVDDNAQPKVRQRFGALMTNGKHSNKLLSEH